MGNKPRLRKLFEPGRIGKMEVKNRIVMAAMASDSAADEGFVTERPKGYSEARARGGVGMIMVGSLCVDYPIGARSTIKFGRVMPVITARRRLRLF